jgi:Arc/MetJ family transcription regulator
MIRRTTIEIDSDLLARAKAALRAGTMRATVEEALRRVADEAEAEAARRGRAQAAYLDRLESLVDLEVLGGDDMWR